MDRSDEQKDRVGTCWDSAISHRRDRTGNARRFWRRPRLRQDIRRRLARSTEAPDVILAQPAST